MVRWARYWLEVKSSRRWISRNRVDDQWFTAMTLSDCISPNNAVLSFSFSLLAILHYPEQLAHAIPSTYFVRYVVVKHPNCLIWRRKKPPTSYMSILSIYCVRYLCKSGAYNTKVTMNLLLQNLSSFDDCPMTGHFLPSLFPQRKKRLGYFYTGVIAIIL